MAIEIEEMKKQRFKVMKKIYELSEEAVRR